MRIYVLKNKQVDFSGRRSSSTPVVNRRCPRGEGSPMRGLILKKTAAIARRDPFPGGEGREQVVAEKLDPPTQNCVGR
jgi:hypothetical protein